MEAGRKLDALVAEKVMGWIQLNTTIAPIEFNPQWKELAGYVQDRPTITGLPPGASHDSCRQKVPPFSTDIAAAWVVVEHMRLTSTRDCFCLWSPTDESSAWFALFDRKWHGRSEVYEGEAGETAAHAICLAALKAVNSAPATSPSRSG